MSAGCWTTRAGLRWIDVDALAAHLRRRGLSVVIVPGAATRGALDDRGRRGFPVQPGALLVHHTATPDTAAGDYPSLRVVRDGRTGLPGPLAQIGLGRSGTVYLIAAGLAWHAGKVASAAHDNWHAVGIEGEDNGTDNRWPAGYYDAYVRLCAALSEPAGLGLSTVLGHKEVAAPAGRKVDPVWSMGTFRRAVQLLRATWATSPPPAPPAGSVRVLRLGVTGADVKTLQVEMGRLFPTYAKLAADGSYGYATARAVREFQTRAKSDGKYAGTVDGIVGPDTRKSLAGYGAKLK